MTYETDLAAIASVSADNQPEAQLTETILKADIVKICTALTNIMNNLGG